MNQAQIRPDFPIVWDSTMVAAARSCMRKLELEYFRHWKPKLGSIHLRAGGAFAKALEVTRKSHFGEAKLPEAEAILAGATALIREYGPFEDEADHAKSLPNMLAALSSYFAQHELAEDAIQPLVENGKPLVEFSFALPLPSVVHPVSGDPILYSGRFDLLGIYNDMLFIVDEKTTGALGPSWFKNWRLRSQITGYCWGARSYGYPVVGAIIRGVALLKREIKHAESIQYRPQWTIDRWLRQTERDITRAIECWREGYFDFDLDTACTNYGGCPFLDVCDSPEPEKWLPASFEKRRWDPLARSEIPLVEIKE